MEQFVLTFPYLNNVPQLGDVLTNGKLGYGIVVAISNPFHLQITINQPNWYNYFSPGDIVFDQSGDVLQFQSIYGNLNFTNASNEPLTFTTGSIGTVLTVTPVPSSLSVLPSQLAVEDTVISQYANSPVLLNLIEAFSDSVNPSANLDAFYNDVWNIDTAQGWGLDNWGAILGVSRTVQIAGTNSGNFGFSQQAGAETFSFGSFFGGTAATANLNLTDSAFRALLLIKAFANICDGSIVSLNKLLSMFSETYGKAYVTNLGNMQMTLTFEYNLLPWQLSVLQHGNVFPLPCGVSMTIVQP